jgi:hypothetical protein
MDASPTHTVGRRGAICLAALAVALAGPATAVAKHSVPPTAVPWVATYDVSASGEQSGSWTLHHIPSGVCDAAQSGSGSVDNTITPDGSVPAFASGVGPTLTSLMLAAPGSPPEIDANVKLFRQSTFDQPAGGGCADGGGNNGPPPPPPDCGTKSAILHLTFDQSIATVLHVAQADDNLPDDPFDNCGSELEGAYPSFDPMDLLVPKVGFGPAPPVGTGGGAVALTGSVPYSEHDADVDADGQQRLSLHFSPVIVTPTIVLGRADTVSANPGPGGGVPVTCPASEKQGCAGSLALGIVTDRPSRFPATFSSPAKPFARASFSLKPGRRAHVALTIPDASRAQIQAIAQAPLGLVVTIGRRHPVRYLARMVHLKP